MAATWRPRLPLQCLWSLRQRSANNTGTLGHSWFRTVLWMSPETWINRGFQSSGKSEHKHLDLRRIMDLWDKHLSFLFIFAMFLVYVNTKGTLLYNIYSLWVLKLLPRAPSTVIIPASRFLFRPVICRPLWYSPEMSPCFSALLLLNPSIAPYDGVAEIMILQHIDQRLRACAFQVQFQDILISK